MGNLNGNIFKSALGVTDGSSAADGVIGEVISGYTAQTPGVSLTSNVSTNIASIVLTAGDWDVSGFIGFAPAATTGVGYQQGGFTATSATIDATDYVSEAYSGTPTFGGNGMTFAVHNKRFNVSSTTTVYLVGISGFITSTQTAWGRMMARRVR